MNIQWTLQAIGRESAPATMRFKKRTDWNMGKERIYYSFHIL